MIICMFEKEIFVQNFYGKEKKGKYDRYRNFIVIIDLAQ